MSCYPWGGAWRRGWTPVECGSAPPEGTGRWTVPGVALAGRARLDHKKAAEGPSDHPTGHRDSCAALTTSSPQSGSYQGNRVPGVGRPADRGSSDSSCLVAPATYLPEDPRGQAASSEGACWAERWAPSNPACVHGQMGMGTDCLGQVDADQGRGRARCRCTDCTTLAVLKRVQGPLLAAAAVAEVVVRHGRAHCTPPHDVLMEDNPLRQDACNPTYQKGTERQLISHHNSRTKLNH